MAAGQEAAVALRVSRHTLFRFIAVRRLPAYRIGGRIQIRRSDIDRFVLEDRRIEPHEVERYLEPDEPLRSIKMPSSGVARDPVADYRRQPLPGDGGVSKVSWFGDREYYGDESHWVYSRPPEGSWLGPLVVGFRALTPLLALFTLPAAWVVNPWGRGVVLGLLLVLLPMAFRIPLLLLVQRSQIRALRGLYSGLLSLTFGGLVVRFLGTFAAFYWIVGANAPHAFTEPLSKIDALYLSVATFSTTGFGDVAAVSDTARLVVTSQMVAGFAIVSVLIALAFRLAEDGDVHILPKKPTLHFHNWPFF